MSIGIIKILKALADETRMRLLNLLYDKKLCVCELEESLGLNQTNVSRHLNKLKDAGILQSEKRAQFVLHFIDQDILKNYPFLGQLLDQVRQMEKFQSDRKKLDIIAAKKGLHCECK